MAKNIQEEANQAVTIWAAMVDNSETAPSNLDETARKMLKFAEPLLKSATVKDVAGQEISGLQYALMLYIEADGLVNNQHNPALTSCLAQCALMVALEDCIYSDHFCSYGAKLLFDIKKAGIKISRPVIAAFLAQEGNWQTNRSKSDLLEGNPIAVGIYCAKLKVQCCMIGKSNSSTGEAIQNIEVSQDLSTLDEILGYYLNEFAVPYLEAVGSKDAKKQIEAFRNYLRQTDFYTAPCSTKYHLSRDGGLAEHTYHVLMNMIWLTLPATAQELGACILAAIAHDLCKIGVYQKQYKSKKTYITSDEEVPQAAYIKEDAGGRFYWADSWYYEFKDSMPFGHGRKSAYILMGFFPEIGEEVYSAVDGHMADAAVNAQFMVQLGANPLAMNLHIADALATYLDEHNQ